MTMWKRCETMLNGRYVSKLQCELEAGHEEPCSVTVPPSGTPATLCERPPGHDGPCSNEKDFGTRAHTTAEAAVEADERGRVVTINREMQLAKLRSALSGLLAGIDPSDKTAIRHRLSKLTAAQKIDMLLAAAALHDDEMTHIIDLTDQVITLSAERDRLLTEVRNEDELKRAWKADCMNASANLESRESLIRDIAGIIRDRKLDAIHSCVAADKLLRDKGF